MSEQGLAVPGVGHRPPVPFSAPRARGFVRAEGGCAQPLRPSLP